MRYRILIVEDSPTMRQLLGFALRRIRGAEIVEASDGLDGLRRLPLALRSGRYIQGRRQVSAACIRGFFRGL